MEDYKNLKEDNDLFPYEYGSLIYNDAMMNKRILDLFRRKELESNMDLIYKHMEENGVVFSSPGGSFQRKLLDLKNISLRIKSQLVGFLD